jgi:CHASE2 domain-containing sensor protein
MDKDHPHSGKFKWFDLHALRITVIIFLIIALVSGIYVNLHFLDPLGHSIKDYEVTDIYYSQIRDQHTYLEKDIVLVNTGWPDRERISAMLDRILEASPKVVGIDVFFTGKKSFEVDSALQATIQRGGQKIVLATVLSDYNESTGRFDIAAVDDSMFSNYTRSGYANFPGNPTRTIRYFSPIETGPNGLIPSFAVEIARSVDEEAVQILLDRKNLIERIHYTTTEDAYIKLNPENILEENQDLSFLKDKIVIMGYSGSEEWNDPLLDRYFTPLNSRYTGKGKPDMFGMVIHANIIKMILEETYISNVPGWLNFIMAFIICYLSLLVLIWISHRYHGVYHPAARLMQLIQFALFFLIIILLYEKYLLKWDFTLGLVALALSVDTQLVYFAGLQYLRKRRQKKMAAAG